MITKKINILYILYFKIKNTILLEKKKNPQAISRAAGQLKNLGKREHPKDAMCKCAIPFCKTKSPFHSLL